MSKLLDNYKKYKVPIHSHMKSSDMVELWNSAPLETRQNFASITSNISNLVAQESVEDSLLVTFGLANKGYQSSEDTVISGAAVLLNQAQYPTLKLNSEASILQLGKQSDVLAQLRESII